MSSEGEVATSAKSARPVWIGVLGPCPASFGSWSAAAASPKPPSTFGWASKKLRLAFNSGSLGPTPIARSAGATQPPVVTKPLVQRDHQPFEVSVCDRYPLARARAASIDRLWLGASAPDLFAASSDIMTRPVT